MKDKQMLNSLALKTRKMWNEDAYSPIDIFSVVNGWKAKKITVIKYPMSSRISGMCTKEGEDIVICINSATSYGRQRFTLAHELYHVLYEDTGARVVCSMALEEERTDSEKEADLFASYLLMPYDALYQYSEGIEEWTLEEVIDAEQFFQVSHQAMIYRLVGEGFLDFDTAAKYKDVAVSGKALRLGYGKELYSASEKGTQYFTTGEYVRKVERLAELDLISEGKREELLMDAFRADIVYGFEEGDGDLND